jgi:hypothetical protein
MNEFSGESQKAPTTESLLLDERVRAHLKEAFQKIDKIYAEYEQQGRRIVKTAPLIVMDRGEVIEVARLVPDSLTSTQPEDCLVHVIDLKDRGGATLARREVVDIKITRDQDLFLDLKPENADTEELEQLSIPAPNIYNKRPKYADHSVKYLVELQEELDVEL